MRVIGTAGHVDHGKSTLVQALTGIHPDRLKEEREREMTIDLGFAFLTLPGGEQVGIVDVPGHRDFIENMLAGVGGIDAVLFVVAADEGVMPQTREHLAILDLLDVRGGVVALTKVDMVDDPEWLDLVEMELHEVFNGTILEQAPILRVSARQKTGLNGLMETLEMLLSETPSRPDIGKPRLPVDRVFTMAGFGTIVTGTLLDGRLNVGDEIEILPGQIRARIRGLQSHNQKEMQALPGTRTAVNISGVSLEQVFRGDWIAVPGAYVPTRRLDLRVTILPGTSQPLKHNSEVKFFIGAAEVVGRARVLAIEQIHPGEQGWLQLELRSPVIARRGDRFILRRPSPGETIGGGVVIDPHPTKRHKRFRPELLSRLEALAEGAPEDVLVETMAVLGFSSIRELFERSNLPQKAAETGLNKLLEAGRILAPGNPGVRSGGTVVVDRSVWEARSAEILEKIRAFHAVQPLRPGMPREALRGQMGLAASSFNLVLAGLVEAAKVVDAHGLIRLPEHRIAFTPAQQGQVDGLMRLFEQNPYSPPSVKIALEQVGEALFAALVELGQLVQVSDDVVFRTEDYDRLVEGTRAYITGRGSITVADFRDHFQTSRKFALALLEHLDAKGVTIRQGDVRKLR